MNAGGAATAAKWASVSMDDRFWPKVQRGPADHCWLWLAQVGPNGYGRFWTGDRMAAAHRVAYELLVGPIPDGLFLDHLCRNRRCVNPRHLEPVTNRENLLRGVGFPAVQARRTHCPRGHEYTPENTKTSSRGRQCRACRTELDRVYRERHRSEINARQNASRLAARLSEPPQ